jgi:hypothetical protein
MSHRFAADGSNPDTNTDQAGFAALGDKKAGVAGNSATKMNISG